MKTGNASRLTPAPLNGTWYRALQPRHYPSALASAHTTLAPSRFSPGPLIATPFEVLYLAETQIVALFEVEAVYGSIFSHIAHPALTFITVPARIRLSKVVDISDVPEQSIIDTDAQALTGDWRGYQTRSARSSIHAPTGIAPTQLLGEQIYLTSKSPRIEGMISLSAKIPTHKTLTIFPQNMLKGSFVEYEYDLGKGPIVHRIDGTL